MLLVLILGPKIEEKKTSATLFHNFIHPCVTENIVIVLSHTDTFFNDFEEIHLYFVPPTPTGPHTSDLTFRPPRGS